MLTHPTKNILNVGRVSECAPAIQFLIYQVGEFVPFATMSSLYERFPHANVQRGLAAAPFAIPAPGGNRPSGADFL
ncbi:hypothetical protein AFK65_08710 [Cronobacter universalis NCTC 9529]|uniref:Uncharacterized protein n=1 Tax=Cronobacter universalis NCTC 9529 TaxID=1074000 RepID=A0AAC9EW28_9ENTR|nr:hypothetical protein AFK65_08710 [Cronobacter universalis NCTC 9529]